MDTGGNRLECRTCPYQHAIDMPIYSRKNFPKKEREDVFGGPGAWDNAQKGRVPCPTADCGGNEAAFFQLQIRSADEPMTTFYKVGFLFACFGSAVGGVADEERAVYDVRASVEGELMGPGWMAGRETAWEGGTVGEWEMGRSRDRALRGVWGWVSFVSSSVGLLN